MELFCVCNQPLMNDELSLCTLSCLGGINCDYTDILNVDIHTHTWSIKYYIYRLELYELDLIVSSSGTSIQVSY